MYTRIGLDEVWRKGRTVGYNMHIEKQTYIDNCENRHIEVRIIYVTYVCLVRIGVGQSG